MRLLTPAYFLASRPRPRPPSLVVLHATAGSSFAGAWATLKAKGLSYHDLVLDEDEGDDACMRCVPVERVAFHAGNSYGPRQALLGVSKRRRFVHGKGMVFAAGCSVNDDSIGICMVNRNDGVDPYSEGQFQTVKRRIEQYRAKFPRDLAWLSTHYWVSPGRKTDPWRFDVQRLHRVLERSFTQDLGFETGLKLWTWEA